MSHQVRVDIDLAHEIKVVSIIWPITLALKENFLGSAKGEEVYKVQSNGFHCLFKRDRKSISHKGLEEVMDFIDCSKGI